jgi:hypothetical protein
MMPLAKKAGSAYLSFGLLVYGFAHDEPTTPTRAPASEAPAASGPRRVLSEVTRGVSTLAQRAPRLTGGEAGAGGAALLAPAQDEGSVATPPPGLR